METKEIRSFRSSVEALRWLIEQPGREVMASRGDTTFYVRVTENGEIEFDVRGFNLRGNWHREVKE